MPFISCSIPDVRSPVCYRYFKARLDVNRSRWKKPSSSHQMYLTGHLAFFFFFKFHYKTEPGKLFATCKLAGCLIWCADIRAGLFLSRMSNCFLNVKKRINAWYVVKIVTTLLAHFIRWCPLKLHVWSAFFLALKWNWVCFFSRLPLKRLYLRCQQLIRLDCSHKYMALGCIS